VGCGQCALACPTGAIVVKDDTQKVWKEIYDKNTRVSVQIAPAVRVALGKELGLNDGENAIGKLWRHCGAWDLMIYLTRQPGRI